MCCNQDGFKYINTRSAERFTEISPANLRYVIWGMKRNWMVTACPLVDIRSLKQMYQPWKAPCLCCKIWKFVGGRCLSFTLIFRGIKNQWWCHIIYLLCLLRELPFGVFCLLIITSKNIFYTNSGTVTRIHLRNLHAKRSWIRIL